MACSTKLWCCARASMAVPLKSIPVRSEVLVITGHEPIHRSSLEAGWREEKSSARPTPSRATWSIHRFPPKICRRPPIICSVTTNRPSSLTSKADHTPSQATAESGLNYSVKRFGRSFQTYFPVFPVFCFTLGTSGQIPFGQNQCSRFPFLQEHELLKLEDSRRELDWAKKAARHPSRERTLKNRRIP